MVAWVLRPTTWESVTCDTIRRSFDVCGVTSCHSLHPQPKKDANHFDSTSDLFFHICIKTVNILVQI